MLFSKCFPTVDKCLSCEDTARQICAMILRWRFLCVIFASFIFSEPRAAHFRMYSKFALRPRHTVDIQSATAENIGEEKERKKKEDRNHSCKI